MGTTREKERMDLRRHANGSPANSSSFFGAGATSPSAHAATPLSPQPRRKARQHVLRAATPPARV